MIKKNQIMNLLLMTLTLLLISCGGGTDPGKTANGKTFSLAKINSTKPLGTVYSLQIRGSDSGNVTYNGTFQRINRAQQTLQGVLVTPSDITISITNNMSNQITRKTTTYFIDTSGYLILSVVTNGNSGRSECRPASPGKLPLTVKVGDTGTMSTLTCADGSNFIFSWRVTDAGNGTISYAITSNEKNARNMPTSLSVDTFTINQGGNIVSMKSTTKNLLNSSILTYLSI